jgi:hypothetical protein
MEYVELLFLKNDWIFEHPKVEEKPKELSDTI